MENRPLQIAAKNLPVGSWEANQWFETRSDANDVRRLEPLRALEQIELHSFAFIERAVSILLNRREMDEHVLAGGALDKAITLCSVKPLHSSLLSHRETPFASSRRIHLAVLR